MAMDLSIVDETTQACELLNIMEEEREKSGLFKKGGNSKVERQVKNSDKLNQLRESLGLLGVDDSRIDELIVESNLAE